MKKNQDLKQILVNHFDNQGKVFFKNYGSSSFIKSWQEPYRFLENYLRIKDLKDKSFLDYCCGTGVHSIFPAKLGARVTGLDFSSTSVENAKKRALFFQVDDKCEFILQDTREIKINSKKYDFIICIQSLLYLDLNQTFNKLSTLLKDDGEIIILESISGNYFFDQNRNKNTKKISSQFSNSLKKYNSSEILKNAKKYFKVIQENYFGLTTSISYVLEKKFKISFFNTIFIQLDFFLKKIPFLRKYFFTLVIVLKK
jgi:ubiquinone/menaquinone biosynthesis C-methylase UbiE